MNTKYVLNACSVIAFLTKEDGADITDNLIAEALDNKAELFMHKINFIEVIYDAWKTQGGSQAKTIFNNIKLLPITIVDSISDDLALEASRLKAGNRISLADAFALAVARLESATLVTSDHHEFDALEASGEATFLWIR